MPPPDMTYQYNTQLSPAEEADYSNWLRIQSAVQKRDVSRDSFDYDMRGAFKSGAAQAPNGHYPDTFKKPNHPSFSDQSQYHGVDGHEGGSWVQQGGQWFFTPGATNLQTHSPDELRSYFQQTDPTVNAIIPPQQAPTMLDYVRQQTQQRQQPELPPLPATQDMRV